VKRQNQYYTLVASLPRLVRFDRAERLPINPQRLGERLRMLEPEDGEVVDRAVALLAWQGRPMARTGGEMAVEYGRLAELMDRPALKGVFEFPVNLRTVMAALRRRHRGLPVPEAGEPWGVGPLARHIERNWGEVDFGLTALYPWIPRARALLESGEALALERLLMSLNWERADRLAEGDEFGFEAVLAYLFKWDLVKRWLSHNGEAAKARFEELVSGVIDEKERVFG